MLWSEDDVSYGNEYCQMKNIAIKSYFAKPAIILVSDWNINFIIIIIIIIIIINFIIFIIPLIFDKSVLSCKTVDSILVLRMENSRWSKKNYQWMQHSRRRRGRRLV